MSAGGLGSEKLCVVFAFCSAILGWSICAGCLHAQTPPWLLVELCVLNLPGARSQEPCVKDTINRWIFYYNFLKIPLLLWIFILQVLLRSGRVGRSQR